MHAVSTNQRQRQNDILWRHKQRISYCTDHHTPLHC